MKRTVTILLAGAALAGCSRTEQTIANQFDQTENAIENSARAIESDVGNATRSATDALDREADEWANRTEAAGNALTTDSRTGNSTR